MNPNQQNQTRSYTEVAAGGSDNQRWEPNKNDANPSYPKQIEGYYKTTKELPGKNGSFMVSEIQMVNPDGSLGICVDVSGGKVLEEKLRNISLGSFVMIQYKGKVQGKLNSYNDWATFVDENAVPLHQLMGVPAPVQAPAFNQAPAAQQQSTNPFGNTQSAPAPVFNQAPVNNSAPAFQQQAPVQQPFQAAPVQNNGQMQGMQNQGNPFAQQGGGDLPF
jgi:hypothetical protein